MRACAVWALAGLLASAIVPRALAQNPAQKTDELSVVTLNLWHDKGDWPKREAQIVRTLSELRPDAIALQEVIGHETLANQAESLADALGYQVVFSSVDPPGKPLRYGNALLTRHPILAQDWTKLEPLDDYRTAVHVRIAFGDRAVNLYGTHLHHTAEGAAIRRRQVADLLAFVARTADGAPSLLLGDFNAEADAPELAAIARGYEDAYGPTHPGIARGDAAHSTLNLAYFDAQRIDHVFVQLGAFAPIDATRILDRADADGIWPSDHFGVHARVRLSPARGGDAPWRDATLTPDARARALLSRMTQDEKFRLLRADWGEAKDKTARPLGALGSAAFIPANTRLGIPSLQETDAGMGVTRPGLTGDGATALPAGIAVAASWDPAVAYAGGAMIGRQAWRKGFNVLLAGGVNLQRDPRNGRNFEYPGEDPLLAGVMAGFAVRGIQDQNVVSTLKHYAVNDLETARNTHSADIGEAAMRESDLLAFEIAHALGRPGSIMCAYNKVNGTYACEHDWLLDRVLKRDWGFAGWVMSDWGGVHSGAKAALAGLDQQSAGDLFDKQVYFDKPLRAALARGEVPQARIDDMAGRVLRSMFAHGLFDTPPQALAIDYDADGTVSRRAAEAGAVLLRNRDGLLPLSREVASIAVIGGHADKGVLSGGGSSTVTAPGGNAVPGLGPTAWPGPPRWYASPPLASIRALAPGADTTFADGRDIAAAVALARASKVAVVFASQWAGEAFDNPTMTFDENQDALIAAVAEANPNTVVVLQTNGPMRLPWLDASGAVLQAWYPGVRGGEAIANLLFGVVDPSGRLPVSWPRDESQLPRPVIEGAGMGNQQPPARAIDYAIEGADVGYKWFAERNLSPLFPFGFGLGYTTFAHDRLAARVDRGRVHIAFDARNTGARPGSDVAQVYLLFPPGSDTPMRLVGWRKQSLASGEVERTALAVEPRMLASWDERAQAWRVRGGAYRIAVGSSASDLVEMVDIALDDAVLPPNAPIVRIESPPVP